WVALIGRAHERRGRDWHGKAGREQRQHPGLSLDEAGRVLVAGEAEDEPPIDAERDVVQADPQELELYGSQRGKLPLDEAGRFFGREIGLGIPLPCHPSAPVRTVLPCA